MSRVAIVGARAVSAAGLGIDPLWRHLADGRTAIAPLTRFDSCLPAPVAACVPGIDPRPGESRAMPLLAGLLTGFPLPDKPYLLIVATTKGCLDLFEEVEQGAAVDAAPATPAGCLALVVSMLHPAPTAAFTVNAACASSSLALARAAALINSGRQKAVLVVAFDLVTRFVYTGFASLKALAAGPCRPFDRHRDGLSLGEGAAAILLVEGSAIRRRGLSPAGWIVGWGSSNDAVHVTAPARDGSGLIRAISSALGRAELAPRQVAAVSAHGTGTVYNDLMELTALRGVFGNRIPPVYGIKGVVGHTLGAAGGIEACVALRAMAAGIVPATVGLRQPAPEAKGLVDTRPRPLPDGPLLLTNSGFGGINAALVLERGGV